MSRQDPHPEGTDTKVGVRDLISYQKTKMLQVIDPFLCVAGHIHIASPLGASRPAFFQAWSKKGSKFQAFSTDIDKLHCIEGNKVGYNNLE
jgi:hypothetical protein